MYRTIFYLHDFEIKELVLSQEYIDFNMREKFKGYSDFISSEIDNLTGYGWSFDKDYMTVTICARPYIIGSIKKTDVLKRFIDNYGVLIRYPNTDRFKCSGYGVYVADTLYNYAWNSMARELTALQNRGMKSKLKNLHYHHSNEMVIQLLNEKIEYKQEQLTITNTKRA